MGTFFQKEIIFKSHKDRFVEAGGLHETEVDGSKEGYDHEDDNDCQWGKNEEVIRPDIELLLCLK